MSQNPRAKLSAVVISFNRAAIITTCLKALAFADEVILVDKSSTDGTPVIAAAFCDRVLSVPWSPTVETTRAFAVAQCRYDWVLCIDDDECLNADAVLFIDTELRAPRAEVYYFPLAHYVMGVHDARAYYWPEAHPRLFRKGAVHLVGRVHGGFQIVSEQTFLVPFDSGACIQHLSHADAGQWIEKTNRYTGILDRAREPDDGRTIIQYAHDRLDHWAAQSTDAGDAYVGSVAALRAIYDVVDRIKAWEQARAQDGTALFAEACAGLEAEYAARLNQFARFE